MLYVVTEFDGQEPEGSETCHEQHQMFKSAIQLIWWVHLFTFVLLLGTLFAHYINQKLAGFMKYASLLTIPLYQGTIMYVFALYNDESGCDESLTSMKTWFQIEVFTFFIYMSIIIFTLIKSRFTNLGIIQQSYVTQEQIGVFMHELLYLVYKMHRKDKKQKVKDFNFRSLIGKEIIVKKQVTLYINEVVCLHTIENKMVEFLDVFHNKEHQEIYEQQIKKGYGRAPVNF